MAIARATPRRDGAAAAAEIKKQLSRQMDGKGSK
jgi:hypothetical protein